MARLQPNRRAPYAPQAVVQWQHGNIFLKGWAYVKPTFRTYKINKLAVPPSYDAQTGRHTLDAKYVKCIHRETWKLARSFERI